MVNWREYITVDPDIMFGKPCFKGSRIPVDPILEKIAYGQPADDLLKSYPKLTSESIQAAQLYALDAVRNDIIFSDKP